MSNWNRLLIALHYSLLPLFAVNVVAVVIAVGLGGVFTDNPKPFDDLFWIQSLIVIIAVNAVHGFGSLVYLGYRLMDLNVVRTTDVT